MINNTYKRRSHGNIYYNEISVEEVGLDVAHAR